MNDEVLPFASDAELIKHNAVLTVSGVSNDLWAMLKLTAHGSHDDEFMGVVCMDLRLVTLICHFCQTGHMGNNAEFWW